VAIGLNKLKLNQQYIIVNCRLNRLSIEQREWPDQELNSNYEMLIDSINCVMTPVAFDMHIMNSSKRHDHTSSSSSSSTSSIFKEPLPPHPRIENSVFKQVNNMHLHHEIIARKHGNKLSKYEKATLLDDELLSSGEIKAPLYISMFELHTTNIQMGSIVNTFGIIEKIDPIEIIKRGESNHHELLNIYINDTTDYSTRVSLWGNQAVNFAHSKGTILMMFDLEVIIIQTNVLGLNYTRRSRFMSIEQSYNIEKAELIRNWYINKQERTSS
jgi:hypothetical protein